MLDTSKDQIFYVAFDATGRQLSATGREDIAAEDARAGGGKVVRVNAPTVFAASRQARETLVSVSKN